MKRREMIMKRSLFALSLLAAAAAGCAPRESGPGSAPRDVPAAPRSRIVGFQIDEPPDLKLSDRSSLNEYLAYAALRNPGLKAAFYRWQAALARGTQARSLPDPQVRFGYFIRQVETRVGAQRSKLGVSQMIPWPGKLVLAGQVAEKAAAAARQRYEAAKLRLFYRVKNAYYEYYYLAKAIEVTKANVDLVKYLEQVARTKYKAGAAKHPDVIRAQVELGKLEDRWKSLRDLRSPLVAQLNAALDRPAEAELPWPKAPPPRARLNARDAQVLAEVKTANPELAALDAEIERAGKAVRLARQSYFPNFMVGVDYVFTDDPDGPMPTEDRGKDPVMVGVGITLPLWLGKKRAAVREARARLLATGFSRRNRENVLLARVKRVLFGVRDAERKIDLYAEVLIPKAKQALGATETAFKAGKVDFLNLIDAQRVLLEFQLSHERALSRHAQRVGELEMLVGKAVPLKRLPGPSRKAEKADTDVKKETK